MKARIKSVDIVRIIHMSDLRSLCVQNNLYTSGNNIEYCDMLNKVVDMRTGESKPLDIEDIRNIAEDIFEHSNIETMMGESGESVNGIMQSILFDLLRISTEQVVTHLYYKKSDGVEIFALENDDTTWDIYKFEPDTGMITNHVVNTAVDMKAPLYDYLVFYDSTEAEKYIEENFSHLV